MHVLTTEPRRQSALQTSKTLQRQKLLSRGALHNDVIGEQQPLKRTLCNKILRLRYNTIVND